MHKQWKCTKTIYNERKNGQRNDEKAEQINWFDFVVDAKTSRGKSKKDAGKTS